MWDGLSLLIISSGAVLWKLYDGSSGKCLSPQLRTGILWKSRSGQHRSQSGKDPRPNLDVIGRNRANVRRPDFARREEKDCGPFETTILRLVDRPA